MPYDQTIGIEKSRIISLQFCPCEYFQFFLRFSTKDDDLLKHSFRVSDNQMISTSGSMKQRLDITELDAGKTFRFCDIKHRSLLILMSLVTRLA